MPDQAKLKKIGEIFKIVNDGVSKKLFTESFRDVLKQVLEVEKKLIARIDNKTITAENALKQYQAEFAKVIEQAKRDSDSTFSGIKRRIFETVSSLFTKNEINRKLTEALNKVDEKMSKVRDGEKGERGKRGETGIGEKGDPGKDGSPDTPEQVADKLEKLKGENKLKIEAIGSLEERLKELEERPIGGGLSGGGVGKIALEAKFVDDETPTGTVNGTNKDFVLANTPNPTAALKVYVNGQKMTVTEDYTLSSRTITFVTAPPTTSIVRCDYRI